MTLHDNHSTLQMLKPQVAVNCIIRTKKLTGSQSGLQQGSIRKTTKRTENKKRSAPKIQSKKNSRRTCENQTLNPDYLRSIIIYYTVSQKKGATLTMAITLSILDGFDGFAKFFHCCKEQ